MINFTNDCDQNDANKTWKFHVDEKIFNNMAEILTWKPKAMKCGRWK